MLRINEIFFSIQGESLLVGKPTVFIRTTGCNLRCVWCDTEYAFHDGATMSIPEIVSRVCQYDTEYVCITGGEPLLQKGTIPLMQSLLTLGYRLSLETGGSLPIDDVPTEVTKIVDIKCPGSGESQHNCWANIEKVFAHDQIKFVIASRDDFDWARAVIQDRGLSNRCTVLLSPVHEKVAPRELAEWILQSRAKVTMQLQMHKAIWGADARGV